MGYKIIDLSLPLTPIGPEHDQPKIKYTDHKRGGFLLGLAGLLYKGGSIFSHLKNLFLYLLGPYRVTAKDFPESIGLAFEEVRLDTHAGTHLDAPYHFGPMSEGKSSRRIDEIPLEWCFGDGVVLDLRWKPPGSIITVEDIKRALSKIGYTLKRGDIVLIMTGADKLLPRREYLSEYPGMGKEATLWLIEQGIKVIGIDAVGFDRAWKVMFDEYLRDRDSSRLWPAHFAGRKREYCHIEKMANLDKIPRPYGFKVACFPIKIEGAGAGWCRAVAILEEGRDSTKEGE